MTMLKKLTDLAKSEKGREFAEKATAKAKQITNDPKKHEKIDAARKKFDDHVGSDDKPTAEADKPAGYGSSDGPVATSSTGAPIDPETAPDPIEPDHDPNPRPSGGNAA